MKTIAVRPTGVDLSLSLDELDLLRNGLNEARLAVKGDADFETRLGVTRDEASRMIEELIAIMARVLDAEKAAAEVPSRTVGR
jgi:hypothetical protein